MRERSFRGGQKIWVASMTMIRDDKRSRFTRGHSWRRIFFYWGSGINVGGGAPDSNTDYHVSSKIQIQKLPTHTQQKCAFFNL